MYMETKELHLVAVSPETTIYDGKVDSVSLPGEMGSFTVLPNHAPLISSLSAGEVAYVQGKEVKSMKITGGFVEVRDNQVSACIEL